MKKAREHYRDYLSEEKIFGVRMATENLVKRIWDESDELMRFRNCHKTEAKIAVYRELCAKWDAICRFDPNFKRGGLRELMLEKVPDTWKEQVRKALT